MFAAAVLVEVAHRVAGGVHSVALEPRSHLAPDLALVGAGRGARGRALVDGVALGAPELRVGGLGRGREVLAVPAASPSGPARRS